ncbi:MAG: ROK family protein [Elusimicrobia bacterium]|nr:ROK family protein [Elusimicrobiota bacterium]
MERLAIGIDVGGTFTKLAAVDGGGRTLREIEIPTHAEHKPAQFVRRVSSVIRLLESELGRCACAVGLGIAGDVDARRGVLRFAPNLPLWNGFNFKRAFESAACPGQGGRGRAGAKRLVVAENDANAAVWGAYVKELGRKPANVIGVALGTGVGGGLVLGGRLYRGSSGSAGELGHTKVDWPGLKCRCGSAGCLEAYAGAVGIVRRAKELLAADGGGGRILRRLAPDPRSLDCRAVALAAHRGDKLARRVWSEAGARLASCLADMVMVLNPEVIIILGGLSRAGALLLDPIREHLRRQPFRNAFDRLSVRVARNPHWGCVGAALLGLDRDSS